MTQVGHFELGAILGGGGMGTVYAAVDTRFGRTVAVKLLHPHLARDPDVVRRFRTEAVIGAKLSHPNVVRVYDVLETGGLVGFVMEHVDGKSLDRLLGERPAGLPAETALRLFRQVVSGVAHAHAAGLVHRDVKPSNVLVEVVDEEPHAKVTDFGVAKVVGGETRLTGMGAKIGTLAYMSPEQIEDPASVDARSDVYSLGVLAYEMLTGQVPFEAGTEFDVMRRILTGAYRPFPSESADVPSGLVSIVRRCLATPSGERFTDARELVRALDAATGSDESWARPMSRVNAAQQRGEPGAARARARPAVSARYREAIALGAVFTVGVSLGATIRHALNVERSPGATQPSIQGRPIQPMQAKAEDVPSRGAIPVEPRLQLASGRMIPIPSGSFRPSWAASTSHLAAFRLDETEVTVAMYEACVEKGPCTAPHDGHQCNWGRGERSSHPINCVNWHQAWRYCAWAGKRLPTEEEWEWAARGGGQALMYPWGYRLPEDQLCWSGGKSTGTSGQREGTCPVATHPRGDSRLGVKDLAGNVWEWTDSWHEAKHDSRVVRGGGWSSDDPELPASSFRNFFTPEYHNSAFGFRCAMTSK